MRITKIINTSLTHFNSLKCSKITDNTLLNNVSTIPVNKTRYNNSNFFNIERGALKESDLKLVNNIKEKIPEILSFITSPLKEIKSKVLENDLYIDAPKNIVALRLNHPSIIAISASVKTARADKYLDFCIHGYFGDKQRFLINPEGEIVKKITPDFFKREKQHAYDADPEYYTQYEINNLGLNKYLKLFCKQMENFKDSILNPQKIEKTLAPQKVIDKELFLLEQQSKLYRIQKKFNLLYDAMTTNSRTSNHLKKFSDICAVKPHRKQRIMNLDNINDKKECALINFVSRSDKHITRIVVYTDTTKTQRLFINGELAEEVPRENSNPFTIPVINKIYTPEEMDKMKTLELLDDIEKRLTYGINQLRAMIGDKISNI